MPRRHRRTRRDVGGGWDAARKTLIEGGPGCATRGTRVVIWGGAMPRVSCRREYAGSAYGYKERCPGSIRQTRARVMATQGRARHRERHAARASARRHMRCANRVCKRLCQDERDPSCGTPSESTRDAKRETPSGGARDAARKALPGSARESTRGCVSRSTQNAARLRLTPGTRCCLALGTPCAKRHGREAGRGRV